MNSIRGHLIRWQLGALALVAVLASSTTFLLAWESFNAVRDHELAQIVYSVLRHGVEYADGGDDDQDDLGQFISQIWDDRGRQIYTSIEADGPPPQADGSHTVQWQGEEWHTFTLRSGGLTLQAASSSADRVAMFARMSPWLLIPFLILLAGLGGLIWVAVGRALRPLEAVRAEITRRDAPSLHALDTQHLPDEVAPLAEALNDLLAKLDRALAAQRGFIADAAHELRTPLTAVRLQAQLASRAQGPEEREAAFRRLLTGVDRASHLVEQLLQMARLEPDARPTAFSEVRLDALAKQMVAEFSSQAEAKEIDLGVGACLPVGVSGHEESLRVMLSNLVDNALRYTPPGGRVDVEVGEEPGKAILSVTDTGPGIPAEERERVFDRFHRLAGADIPGSGLGLAIVRQVARLHGGEISLGDAPGGGLLARVVLPGLSSG